MARSNGSLTRRGFVGAPAAAAAAITFEHRPLVAHMQGVRAPAPDQARGAQPTGQLGKLRVTRLICGGNLFSGFAHSGDLLYVSSLLRNYFTEDKILDTLQLCEAGGINTTILRTDDHIVKVLKRYRKERGGKLQWIAQTYPTVAEPRTNIQMAIDNGAVGAFIMGGNTEKLCADKRTDVIAEALDLMKRNGLVCGVGAHKVADLKTVVAARIDFDFHFKTLNTVGYACDSPDEVTAYMKTVKKPWVGFKVLGAGRMKARDGFDLAFRSGADFINVGMYDFQVKEDIGLARASVAAHAGRQRPWSV